MSHASYGSVRTRRETSQRPLPLSRVGCRCEQPHAQTVGGRCLIGGFQRRVDTWRPWHWAGHWRRGKLSTGANVLGRGSVRLKVWQWGHAMPFGGIPRPGSWGRCGSPVTGGPDCQEFPSGGISQLCDLGQVSCSLCLTFLVNWGGGGDYTSVDVAARPQWVVCRQS